MTNPFSKGKWIWCRETPNNAYTLFVKTVPLSDASSPVHVRITASYHYELYVNGTFIARGPVHGDPHWCQYDELEYAPKDGMSLLHVAILVHHSSGTHLHYQLPAPGGLIAELRVGGQHLGTDASWKCLPLEMWLQE